MAKTPTLPQLQQRAVSAGSDVPTFDDTPATVIGPWKQPPTKWRWTARATVLTLIITIAANLVMIALIAGGGDPASASQTRPPVRTLPLVRSTPSAPAGTLATTFGEGKFVVGKDIAPGTYRTTGKSAHPDCYWERLKDTNGTTASIIANDLAPGPATVTIDKSDAAFQTRWCNTWTKVS